MMPDGRPEAPGAVPRGRPARSPRPAAGRPDRPRRRTPIRAGAVPALDDELALVRPDLEERRPAARGRRRQLREQPFDHRETIRATVQCLAGSKDAAIGRPGRRPSGRTAGWRGRDRTGRRPAEQIRCAKPTVADRMTDRVLARQVEGLVRFVDGQDRRRPARPAVAATRRAPRRSRRSPSRRPRSGSADRRPARAQPPLTSASASSTRRSVSGRGIRARASTANASP